MMKNDLLQRGGSLTKDDLRRVTPVEGRTSGSISIIVVEMMACVIKRVNVRTYTHTPWRQETINFVVWQR